MKSHSHKLSGLCLFAGLLFIPACGYYNSGESSGRQGECPFNQSIDVDNDGVTSVIAGGKDCDDNDALVNPMAKEIPYNGKDDDCDPTSPDDDLDKDHFSKVLGKDCNDQDAKVYPGADEIPYDGIDQDCSGSDLNDVDQDGYIAAQVPNGRDCDDFNPMINPLGYERCDDDVDQDCSGADLSCSDADMDQDGYSPNSGDCNDRNSEVHPGKLEVAYNGLDDDCDLLTPDDDLDRDGFTKTGGGDCDDSDAAIHPFVSEIPYDGIDQDCSGGDLVDLDRDGFTATIVGGKDCNDHDGNIHPGAQEIPADFVDQNCDGNDYIDLGSYRITDDTMLIERFEVAFGGNHYLVVWIEEISRRSEFSNIMGQLLDRNGNRIGQPITIRVGVSSRGYMRVASSGDDFLVIWTERNENLSSIMAQRLANDGSSLGEAFIIATSGSLSAVAFGGNQFLIIWHYLSPEGMGQLHGKRLGTDGVLGEDILIHTYNDNRYHYPSAVASNGTDFLVVWKDWAAMGKIVQMDSALIGESFIISDHSLFREPGVASDGSNYLVVLYGHKSIIGQFVSGNGDLLYSRSQEHIIISDTDGYPNYPSVVYVDGFYLVVWSEEERPGLPTMDESLFGQKVGLDGSLQDTTSSQNMPINVATGRFWDHFLGIYKPRAFLASDRSDVLVIFQHPNFPPRPSQVYSSDESTDWDIYGTMLSW